LKRNLDAGFLFGWLGLGFTYAWALKKEKNNLNQIRVVSFVKLEDFPLATFIKIVIILFIVY